MYYKLSKLIIVLLLALSLIYSGACLLDKINTNIVVFGQYDGEIEKLDLEAKLTYVNIDTSEKKPLVGKTLTMIVNVTKNSNENEILTRTVNTNGVGWAKRTFYLNDVKEYQVLVKYEGDSSFKESVGTLGGGGEFDENKYTTSLPEGISLTTCLPIMVLVGFLGAAMYASGGNPFGFVDMTTTRGFRMNRNLRKTMFVQGLVGSIGSSIFSGIKIYMKLRAKKKTEDAKKEEEEENKKEEKEKNDKAEDKGKKEEGAQNQKVPMAAGATGTPKSKNAPGDNKAQGKTFTAEGGKKDSAPKPKEEGFKAGTNVKKWEITLSKVLYALGAMFTGDIMDINYMEAVVDKQIEKNKIEMERNGTTIGMVKDNYLKMIADGEKQKKRNERTIKKHKDGAKELGEKVKKRKDKIGELKDKLKEKGLSKDERKQIKEKIKELENQVKHLDKKIENHNKKINELNTENSRITSDIKKAEQMEKMINDLQKKMGGNIDKDSFDNLSLGSLENSKLFSESDEKTKEIIANMAELGKIVDVNMSMESNFSKYDDKTILAIQYGELNNDLNLLRSQLEKEPAGERRDRLEKAINEAENRLKDVENAAIEIGLGESKYGKFESPEMYEKFRDYEKSKGMDEILSTNHILNNKDGLKDYINMEENKEKQEQEMQKLIDDFKRERGQQLDKEKEIISAAMDMKDGKVPDEIQKEFEKEIKFHINAVNEANERIKSGRGNEDDEKMVEKYGSAVESAEKGSNAKLISEIGRDLVSQGVELKPEVQGVIGYLSKIESDTQKAENYYNRKMEEVRQEVGKMSDIDEPKRSEIIAKATQKLEEEKKQTLDVIDNQLNRNEFENSMASKELKQINTENYGTFDSKYDIMGTVISSNNEKIGETFNSINYDKFREREEEISGLQLKMGIITAEEYVQKNYMREAVDKNKAEEFEQAIVGGDVKWTSAEDYVKAYDFMLGKNSEADKNGTVGTIVSKKIDEEIKKMDEKIRETEMERKREEGVEVKNYDKEISDLEKRKKELMEDKKNIATIVQEKVSEEFLSNKNVKEIVEKKYEYKESKLGENLSLFDEKQKKEMEDMNKEMMKKQEEFFAKKKKPKKPEDE